MYTITLDLLRRAVSPAVVGFRCQPIKVGNKPSRGVRVFLDYCGLRAGARMPASIVAKIIGADWPGDPHAPEREYRVVSELLPRAGVVTPRLFWAERDGASGARVLLMEDMVAYRFPRPTHVWTPAEGRCILRAYAALHATGGAALPPEDDRDWLWPSWETALERDNLGRLAHELAERPDWRPVDGVEGLLCWAREVATANADWPVTLLHGDIYPPNAGLPADLAEEAMLIDWEMSGAGPAELDLAYLFMQPHRAERYLARDEMLAYYWAQRAAIGGAVPSAAARRLRQRYADAVLALALVPVAHRVMCHPHAPGSLQEAYWKSMFRVLNERLVALCHATPGGAP